ncbi:tRNA glutamyl-Q(34) synthetase GluQRS [Opitutus terrae]|uniref:Glutamyl-tRNA synthetase class Ic n=1 Tax=Opitutus terrae (strain DSM 11246 / JCM 15787 / PB90-1) TaxID=452637 RepID=B1ZS71_OPITP|nr:tRNA glutamyl-Q(34) synthetase GluQRS [Opitutus terrae]ACB75670.1 glutamyl-tRNA synthetase class Ic [Opitutus terrae PB90-1]
MASLNSQLSALNSGPSAPYRGRLAPSPTGLLHLGHARTFWFAAERARAAGGTLVLRNDDLDSTRYRMDFVAAMIEDLHWLGFDWSEGPDVDGPHAPYNQSERRAHYRAALEQLHAAGLIFPCTHSRRDVIEAVGAPHADDEPVYPKTFRPPADTPLPPLGDPITVNWRFRVPDEELVFHDGRFGEQRAIAGRDFGDFLVWRKDDVPSYQLSCAVDDATMQITEVVRGADLIKSTFRQLLLLRALGHAAPRYFHCPLMTDDRGERLAKRHDALSLRALRERGASPREICEQFSRE